MAARLIATEHQPGPLQETDLISTTFRHMLSDRIIGHARTDGTIGWVDSITGFLYFEGVFSVLGGSRLASKRRDGATKGEPRGGRRGHNDPQGLKEFSGTSQQNGGEHKKKHVSTRVFVLSNFETCGHLPVRPIRSVSAKPHR